MNQTIENPILPGFHPDASALQVGKDYYIATSTFEWWPGIDIYHSRDLVHWEWCSAPLTQPEQVPSGLPGNYNSGSLWAPHLSWSEGLFWLVYTDVKSATAFKDTLNYVITAPTIAGPWSAPTLVSASGFDPSLFHDTDGRHYFLNMLFDWRLENPSFAGTVIQEFDPVTRSLVGKRRHFYKGTSLGVCEGPQILQKDGWYYLLCAAGGTGYHHAATVARARTLDGPWEDAPNTPLLTAWDAPDNPLQKSGHACFLEKDGQWYITHICARPLTHRGNCPLGRETALQKIQWVDGWPQLENTTHYPDLTVEVSGANTPQRQNWSEFVSFTPDSPLPPSFKSLRGPLNPERDYSLTLRPGWLRLYGGQSLSTHHYQTLLARRWQSFCFTAETELDFDPANFQQLAGLILYYDTCNWIYAFVSRDDEGQRYVRVLRCDNNTFCYGSPALSLENGPVSLRATVNRAQAQFDFCTHGGTWHPLGGAQPADHLSDDYIRARRGRPAFTGAMVGICAQDMDVHRSFADFRYFRYEE